MGHRFKEELTKPTNRLKEAKLLSLMEHAGRSIDDEAMAEAMKGKGLGTPATRADTIEKLISGILFKEQDQVVYVQLPEESTN